MSDLQKIIRHLIFFIRHLIFRKCRIIFPIILVDIRVIRKIHADYQALKKEVNPDWGRPPFLYYKDNTFSPEMQIEFLSALVKFCEKLLQMRVGNIAFLG